MCSSSLASSAYDLREPEREGEQKKEWNENHATQPWTWHGTWHKLRQNHVIVIDIDRIDTM
jgi:hypothetical protein